MWHLNSLCKWLCQNFVFKTLPDSDIMPVAWDCTISLLLEVVLAPIFINLLSYIGFITKSIIAPSDGQTNIAPFVLFSALRFFQLVGWSYAASAVWHGQTTFWSHDRFDIKLTITWKSNKKKLGSCSYSFYDFVLV